MAVIQKIVYGETAVLKGNIQNPKGGTADILVKKEDGKELKPGKSEVCITASVKEDGGYEAEMIVDEDWEYYKDPNKNDKLIANIDYQGSGKKSSKLELIPKPQIIVDFRRNSGYAGEYGFDWFRDKRDRKDYNDIVGKFNASNVFVKDAGKVSDMKRIEYFEKAFSWYHRRYDWYYKNNGNVDKKYLTPTLSIYPNKEVELTILMEVFEESLKELELEYDSSYFTITPDKLPIKGKGSHKLSDHIKIKCIKEFSSDQTIKVKAYDRQLGELKVLKNSKSNRYEAKVVFVRMRTKINGVGSDKTGGTAGEEAFLEKYMNQALVKPAVETIFLDVRTDATFNSDYVLANGASNVVHHRPPGKPKIHNYLNGKMDAKYNNYYKVYFFNESGGYMRAGSYRGLNGGANGIPSKSVALYSSHNTSTTTHELLHAMGLYHTFSNSSKHAFKNKVTENIMDYSHHNNIPRISTYKWQWKTVHSNVDKES